MGVPPAAGSGAGAATGPVEPTVAGVVVGTVEGTVKTASGFCPSLTATPEPPKLIVKVLWLPGGSQ